MISVIAIANPCTGQEGEQNGYYRSLLNLIPSSNPFLTRSAGPFAFSALNQNFVVNGTCSPADNALFAALPVFGTLTVDTKNIEPKDQKLSFTISSEISDLSDYSLVLINQQNLPIVEKIVNVQKSNGKITFEAEFPGATFIMDGLTIAAITQNAGPFADAPAVAAATLFGPGLIEVN